MGRIYWTSSWWFAIISRSDGKPLDYDQFEEFAEKRGREVELEDKECDAYLIRLNGVEEMTLENQSHLEIIDGPYRISLETS